MAIRKVLRIGDPQLRRHAGAVDRFGDAALGTLITDMLDTMKACDGAGLAAPQVGVPRRVVIFGIDNNSRYPDAAAHPADSPGQSGDRACR